MAAGCQTSADITGTVRPDPLMSSDRIGGDDLAAGKVHYASGNFGLAEKHFRKAVELNAGSGDAWLGLAASYDRLGRFDFADRAYEQLIKVAGRTPRVINNMGYSQYLRGDRAQARKLLFEARAALPGDPVVEANLSMLD
jgi:Flp pilus assembly protein TadD